MSKIIKNKKQIKLFEEWLPYKNKEKIKCKLIYDAKKDGVNAITINSLCDNKGSALTIISKREYKVARFKIDGINF